MVYVSGIIPIISLKQSHHNAIRDNADVAKKQWMSWRN